MSAATGALLGLAAGAGALLAASRVPARRRPALEDRVSPYLVDAALPSRLLEPATPSTAGALGRLLRPVVSDGAARLDRWLGGSASVRRRLDLLDGGAGLEEFRAQQVLWGAAGLGGALGLGLLAVATGRSVSPPALALLCVLAGVAGVLARDRVLTRDVRRREEQMMAEFPTVAELLALAVAAGEGAVGALERVARLGHGALTHELARTLAQVRAGVTLVEALDALAARTSLPALQRFVDGVVVAVERGTPLAEVLRAQAVDVREAGRRALIETGARREVGMMVPVVFLVLPVSVAFALFPGFYGLSLTSP